MSKTKHDAIRAYYHTLFSAWGRQHWWPAQSPFEMIVGAYLTQNTSWTNVERALGRWHPPDMALVRSFRLEVQATGEADLGIEFIAVRRDRSPAGRSST